MNPFFKILLLLAIIITFAPVNSIAQVPPPPPPNHGSTGNQTGGNAPVGGGLFILLGLGAAYGSKKLFDSKKHKTEE